jgi:CHAT domain-containing protein
LIVDDSRHRQSISLGLALFRVILVTGWAIPAMAGNMSCNAALGTPAASLGPLKTQGTRPLEAQLPVAARQNYLIEIDEEDADVMVDVLDAQGKALAHLSQPERRSGTGRALITAVETGTVQVRAVNQEQSNRAAVTIRAFDVAALKGRPACAAVFSALAAADADYAKAQDLAHARSTEKASVQDTFKRAASEYMAAEQALTAPEDEELKGQTALALAGVEYLGLHDWASAADWATQAAKLLGKHDPYRQARAEALLAQSWMEIGKAAGPDGAVALYGVPSTQLLNRAIERLEGLHRFHLQRAEHGKADERYDAALALNNVSVTEYYQGRYTECAPAAARASHEFAAVGATMRRAQALQNHALCLWGAGRLPEALPISESSLKDISPETYPQIYLASLNNTALINWALGHLDEALALFDRARGFAQQRQSSWDEGQARYGIGVTYYALGDRERARDYLEQSLRLHPAAVDGRGRMTTLRALATVDADQGKLADAIAHDREALSLAVSPALVGRIRIQLALHTAANGKLQEAKAMLDEVLESSSPADVNLAAEARLQRGRVLRQMGLPAEALTDLRTARTQLRRDGSVVEEFAADLELARVDRIAGHPDEAMRSVDEALKLSDAVRLETANPELRAQLQAPLRPAYDLKIELLRARYETAVAAGQDAAARALAAAAFVTADGSRARSLADVAAQQYSPEVRAALQPALTRREQLYRELAARRFTLDTLLDSGSSNPRARKLAGDITELTRQLDIINTDIARRTLVNPSGSAATAQLPVLPPDTALVSYWLGGESAYAWVIARGEISWMRLASPAAIAGNAGQFHELLTRFGDRTLAQRLAAARELYGLVLQPLEKLLTEPHQWVIIPDGALDYVPFIALRQPSAGGDVFVATQHDVAYAPAAWMLGPRPTPAKEQPRLLVVADPVYQGNDSRLAPPARAAATAAEQRPDTPDDVLRHDYQRLPYTAREAARISSLFRAQDVESLQGLDASRERLLALDWTKYRYIHIATHGVADAQVPQLSALILSNYDAKGERIEGAVRVADISVRTLTAEVAVLSACDTASGRQFPSEGLVGIASTMLARGAHAVVASLWPVSDEMAERLMTEFYRHLLHDSMSPSVALGTSMRSVLAQDGTADPALWATFQVSVVALGSGLPTRNALTASAGKDP